LYSEIGAPVSKTLKPVGKSCDSTEVPAALCVRAENIAEGLRQYVSG
jgi:hypothetical protein